MSSGVALACALAPGAQGAESTGLRAGAASVAIEIPVGVPLAGYGARGPGNQSETGSERVGARALVLEGGGGRPRIGIVVLDVLIVWNTLRTAVVDASSDLDLDALVVAATHTHSGPGGYVDDLIAEAAIMGWHRERAQRGVVEAADSALHRAARALTPARLGVGIATAPNLTRNRRHPGGPTDPAVPVLRVDSAGGTSIATVFALAAHPTFLGPENLTLSPDYPGPARREVEARRGGVALFLAGPLGDQRPNDILPEAGRRENAEAHGARLGALVAATAEHAEPSDTSDIAHRTAALELPPVDIQARCAGWIFGPLVESVVGRSLPTATPITALRLGALTILASPFELGVEVAGAIRDRFSGPLLIAAHAGDWVGYLLMPDDYESGGYEACLSFHGPKAAPAFVAAAVATLRALDTPKARNATPPALSPPSR